jgi:hypothetical protein
MVNEEKKQKENNSIKDKVSLIRFLSIYPELVYVPVFVLNVSVNVGVLVADEPTGTVA